MKTVWVLMYDTLPFRVFPDGITPERRQEIIDGHKGASARQIGRAIDEWPDQLPTAVISNKGARRQWIAKKVEDARIHFRKVEWRDR